MFDSIMDRMTLDLPNRTGRGRKGGLLDGMGKGGQGKNDLQKDQRVSLPTIGR